MCAVRDRPSEFQRVISCLRFLLRARAKNCPRAMRRSSCRLCCRYSSAISTLKSLGPTPAFVMTWPTAWALSWLVAFPTLLAVLPLVRRIVAFAVEAPPSN